MVITDEAKKIIMEVLKESNCDCLKVVLEKSCCGTSLNFGLTRLEPNDISISINGISVLMDAETESRVEMITLAVEDGDLVIQDNTACASRCGDGSCCC
jgi:Fe-S cluster assembly iron-binding protein IscA